MQACDMQKNRNDLLRQCREFMAVKSYEKALLFGQEILQENEQDCDAMYMMAVASVHLANFSKAWLLIDKIKKIDEEHIGAYMAEVYIYKKRKEFVQEKESLEQLIKRIEVVQQKEPMLWNNSLAEAWSLLGSVYTILGMPQKALSAFLQSSQLENDKNQAVCEYSNALFVTNYIEDMDCKEMKKLHANYTKLFLDIARYPHFLEEKKVLRIGYISPDLHLHPVAFFVNSLLTAFSEARFEVYCYSNSAEDFVTEKLKARVVWRNIQGLNSSEAAEQIYKDHIDILVDLSGHTKNNCLPVLAYQPAPVQISGIGYFNTTGLETIHYFLSDTYCDPTSAGAEAFTETLLCLHHSHFCYMPVVKMPLCPLQAPCHKNGYITFGSFNNFNKVTDQMLVLWQRILTVVPRAKLVLKSQIFTSEEGCAFMRQRFSRLHMDLSRIEVRGLSDDYLEQYADIDIALDTYPYTGGATTCEALYMGVPVVTLCGRRHGSRFGYSLLMNAGLAEFVTFTPKEYVEKAVLLASDMDLLDGLRQNLRTLLQKSDLMNVKQYVEEVETAYQDVWAQELKKQADAKMTVKKIEKKVKDLWTLIHRKKYQEAEAVSQLILLHEPKNKEVLEVLTGIYIECGKKEKAKLAVEKLLQQYPRYAYGLFLAARAEYLEENWTAVIGNAQKALQFSKNTGSEVISRIYNLLGNSYKNIGESANSIQSYKQAVFYATGALNKTVDYSNYLFNLHYLASVEKKEMYEAHRGYNNFFAEIVPYSHEKKRRHDKIRIGYISPDLRYHVVVFFSYAFFKYYDRERFSVVCYAHCGEDAVSRDIAGLVDGWRNISGMNEAAAASCIYEDEIDILFDLSGHTKGSCLPILAYNPAPVQISGIGYFDTTGLATVDYFLADIYTDPQGLNDDYFTEKILRLPHSHFCYVPPDTMPECAGESPVRKTGYITFGSFNNFTKTTDEMLLAWWEILERVEQAKLLFKSRIFGSADGRKKIEQRLQDLGFDLNRVEMRPETDAYLAEYKDVDIALDTYPYPGGGTTCEALYMGVPVITLVGERHGARFGYSLLKNTALDRCCAFSKEQYIEMAVHLAGDMDLLDDFHKNLRQRMKLSPLMQGENYMREIEQVYSEVYEAFLLDLPLEDEALKLGAWTQAEKDAKEAWEQEDWPGVFHAVSRMQSFGSETAEACYLLAVACFKLKKQQQAIEAAARALAFPDVQHEAELQMILGLCYRGKSQYASALRAFLAVPTSQLGLEATGKSLFSSGERKKNMAELQLLSGQTAAAWESYQQAISLTTNLAVASELYQGYMMAARYLEKDLLPIVAEYNVLLSSIKKQEHRNHSQHAKIRIGYISSAFCAGSMFYFYHQLLACYDRNRFSVNCYHTGLTTDGFTKHCKGLVDAWQELGKSSSAEIAEKIYQDEIDILVDVSGENGSMAALVFAYKPAPMQISGWKALSMAVAETDYIIVDDCIASVDFTACFAEKKNIRIPSAFCYTGRSDILPAEDAPFYKNKYITLGCFSPYPAITDAMLELWQGLLAELPTANLWFFSSCFSDEGTVEIAKMRLEQKKYDLARVEFMPLPEDAMDAYRQIDLVLDVYPATDEFLLCNALYMGVPVVSLYGKGIGGSSRSLLKSAGLEELAVGTAAAYTEKVIALAKDEALLNMLHKNLRTIVMQSTLMNEKIYLSTVEEMYHHIWQKTIF